VSGNGAPPPGSAEKNLGEIVSEVSEKASLLVRQEIDLAKAEVSQKVTKLTRGIVAAVAAGVFVIFGVAVFFNGLAWFLNDLLNEEDNNWVGFGIVSVGLFVLGIIAALLALRLFKKGAPPTPEMAIEEAKRTREQLERSTTS
jgi:archaellum biogenesis protein FlaJ (TadC family)